MDGEEVTLTFQEFELLAFLSAHPATVFTRADLVQRVWQRDFAADSRTVDVHVSRLTAQARADLRAVPGHRVPGWLPVPPVDRLSWRGGQPLTSGPALCTLMRSKTRLSRSMAAR